MRGGFDVEALLVESAVERSFASGMVVEGDAAILRDEVASALFLRGLWFVVEDELGREAAGAAILSVFFL